MNEQETKPLWKVAYEAYYAVEGYGERSWTTVIDTVIAEHERRKAANFYDQIRPLPVKPDPVLVPLGSEDVPPGSVMRHKDQYSWFYRYVQPGDDWITFVDDGTHLSFQRAFDDFVINRNDGKGWQPCAKEVQP